MPARLSAADNALPAQQRGERGHAEAGAGFPEKLAAAVGGVVKFGNRVHDGSAGDGFVEVEDLAGDQRPGGEFGNVGVIRRRFGAGGDELRGFVRLFA